MCTWFSDWRLSTLKETSLKAKSRTCSLSDIYYCPFTIIDHHQTPFKFLKTINRLGSEWVLWPYPLSRSCLLQQPSFSLQNTGQRQRYRGEVTCDVEHLKSKGAKNIYILYIIETMGVCTPVQPTGGK
jgi:hypothetical protein